MEKAYDQSRHTLSPWYKAYNSPKLLKRFCRAVNFIWIRSCYQLRTPQSLYEIILRIALVIRELNLFEALVLGIELGLVVGAMLGFIIGEIRYGRKARVRYRGKYLKELLDKGLLDKKDLNNPIVRAMIWRAFLEGERLGERRKSV